MISASSTIQFPFGNRRALVSIDSNCSRHMTGFYTLLNSKPCSLAVNGAFEGGKTGQATSVGTMQLGQLFFHGTVSVPGLRETILSECWTGMDVKLSLKMVS